MRSATCPECGKTLRLTDEETEPTLVCPRCHHEFDARDAPVPASTDEFDTLSDVGARAPRPRRRRPDSDDYGPRRRRPRREGPSTVLIVGLVMGGLFLVCSGLGVGGYFLFVHEIDVPVEAADRSLVVTAKRVAEFVPKLRVEPARDTFQKVRTLDGSRQLTYEYESIHDEDNILYVNHQVYVDQTLDGAQGAYVGLGIGTRLFGFQQVKEVERNDLWKWGDTSRCAILMRDGKSVGNLFMARKGRRYFLLIIVGVYFEEKGAIHDLLDPFLQRLDAYEG